MKIQYALMSCNADPRFTAYWPPVAAAWLKLGITPVCLFIPDDPATKLPAAPKDSIVHTVPSLNDVHIMPQVLMLRFWASYLYPNAIIAISDMDFVPLSTHFFHTQLAPYPDHTYIHLRPDPDEYKFTNISQIPEKVTRLNKMRYLKSWFHVAKGEVMHDVLNLLPDWETTCKKTLPYYLQRGGRIALPLYSWKSHRERVPWFGDEIYTSIQLHHSSHRPIYYISYQLAQYSGLIWDIIPLVRKSINIKRDRFVGIHLPPPNYPEDRRILEHLLCYGTVPKPKTIFWWYIRSCYWLVQSINVPKARARIAGPWVCLFLIILIWCVIRLFPPPKPYNRILLSVLWHKRTLLLVKSPLLTRPFYALLRIKNAFSLT